MSETTYPKVRIETLADTAPGSFKIGPFGSSLRKEELVSDGIPVVGIENVLANKFLPAFRKFITEEKFSQLSQYMIKSGDVLVTTMGTIGRAAVVPDSVDRTIIDSHLFRMRLDKAKVDPTYLCFAINGYRGVQEEINRMASGAIMAGLNTTILKSCSVPLPPLPEQKRIAAILNEQMTEVERARAAAEHQLEAAQALPAAYLREVFNSSEAQKWPKKPLRAISEIAGGIQKTPERAPTKSHKPYLTVRNVQRGYLDLSQVDRFEVAPEELTRLRLLPGDILVVEGNGSLDHIGRNALFDLDDKDWIHQNHIIRVRLDRQVCHPEFTSRFLNSERGRLQMIEKAKTTSGLYTLSAGKVASLEVPIPSLLEQERFVGILREQTASAERTRKALEAQLATINKLPAALLRRAFSGEL